MRVVSSVQSESARKYLPYIASTAIQALALFVPVPLLSRHLSRVEFGVVALALAISVLAGIALSAGIPGAITRSYFFEEDGRSRARFLLKVSASAQLGLSGVCSAALFADARVGAGLVAWASLAIGSALAATHGVLSHSRARSRRWPYFFVVSFVMLFPPLVALVVCALDSYDAHRYLAVAATTTIFTSAISVLWELRTSSGKVHPLRDLLTVQRFSLPLVIHGVALAMMSSGDRLVIAPILGVGAVGRYQVAYILGAGPIALLLAMNNVLAPTLYASDRSILGEKLRESTWKLYATAAALIVLVAYLSPIALWVLVPEEYGRSGLHLLCIVVALSAFPYAVYLSNVHGLFIEGRTVGLALTTPAALIIALGLAGVGAWFWGLIGAALAALAGYIALAILTIIGRQRVASLWAPGLPPVSLVAAVCFAAVPAFVMGLWV